MNKIIACATMSILLAAFILAIAQEKKPEPENFYENSLHYTSRGLEYWYAKEQGGLERITGIPFSELPCAGCHVRSCDTCHKKESGGKASYSLEPARAQEVCQNCHGIESLEKVKKNPEDPGLDVHFKQGMKCMDCHTAREIHGDGTPYNSAQDPGAMDAKCENCHNPQSECPSHAAHKGKVDCNACHVRDLTSCCNCHFDTRVKEGKSVSLPLKNLLSLVNHDNRVTLGTLHTFVYENKTMMTFAPSFPHSVMKEGRTCEDCHATPLLRDIREGKFQPVRFENGELKNVQGIVPVPEGWKWGFPFLNFEKGRWVPIENPAEPLVNFAGYSAPLTREQLARLEEPRAKE
ncbi:MAG: hypothetical protein PHX45_01115 [Acidobacteriota bacterium]|nr:hypothetical protein [Acidobacteriota bacterium]